MSDRAHADACSHCETNALRSSNPFAVGRKQARKAGRFRRCSISLWQFTPPLTRLDDYPQTSARRRGGSLEEARVTARINQEAYKQGSRCRYRRREEEARHDYDP